RINNGYFPNGTIPLAGQYDAFAARCANFVTHSPGCSIWVIGNECNIQGEWPFTGTNFAYVSPTNYAACFRKVYTAIKAVHPNDKVVPQPLAPFAGPYSAGTLSYNGTNYPADGVPINWVTYLNQMLTAIKNSGPLDGIALHIYSRGYDPCANVFSTQQVSAGGQNLYFSFYCYKDWINLGIPGSLYNLPLYATECDGYYYWKGGHPENPSATYQPGWMQQVYGEINRYNQFAAATGKPVFHCVNMYRWCQCDGWNIDGSDNPYESQILGDLDAAAAFHYTWPTNFEAKLPIGMNFMDPSGGNDSVPACNLAGVVPMQGWVNLTTGGTGTSVALVGNATVTWTSTGGGTHTLPFANSSGDTALMRDYLDTGDTSTDSVTVSGLSFSKYDVYVYADGDNGGESRVGKYTLNNTITRYLMDAANVNFSGTYTEVNSSTGGPSTPAGNYIRFRNITGSSFTLKSTASGQYGSGSPPHPRAPINAIEIVPVTPATLSLVNYNAGRSRFQFYVNGVLNNNYTIQTSTDLINWVSVQTSPAPFTYIDYPVGGGPAKFYRALYQP
ncbi:MAG TPA: hypothetical protein VFC07_08815, partial [Verrucomicrobiae bacterium]|nr:hypothetical protein [Verrucomicrobiae bacterium]